ncbi:hypothetical protein P9D31_04885 [Bacillus haynesii]|uniref:hypothetical protein n=1 Tax=Bacillus haynesii TaxID=1925021 RepID=UPI002DBBB0F4|nr:hypothetical protein [Bacillus haynesii]MEC1471698.1 hypothetical protein [Bacillus haynesii]
MLTSKIICDIHYNLKNFAEVYAILDLNNKGGIRRGGNNDGVSNRQQKKKLQNRQISPSSFIL